MSYNVFQKGPRKGQPKTIQDKMSRFLEMNYSAIEEQRTSVKYKKYLVGDNILYVGKNGAVRVGKSISSSLSITGKMKRNLEIWEQRKGF